MAKNSKIDKELEEIRARREYHSKRFDEIAFDLLRSMRS